MRFTFYEFFDWMNINTNNINNIRGNLVTKDARFHDGLRVQVSVRSGCYSKRKRGLILYLDCRPIESCAETWSCNVSYCIEIHGMAEIKEKYTDSFKDRLPAKGSHCFSKYSQSKNIDLETWDEDYVKVHRDPDRPRIWSERLVLEITIEIGESNLKTSKIKLTDTNTIFQRTISYSDMQPGSVLEATHIRHSSETWKMSIRKSSEGLMQWKICRLSDSPYDNRQVSNDSLVIVTLTDGLLSCSRDVTLPCGDEWSNIPHPSPDNDVLETLVIDVKILTSSTYKQKTPPICFGREAMSVPQHGNFTLLLADGTKLKLNSLPLSHNSPELKRLILDSNIDQHDVSDFHSDAVKIFVDACYTGTLQKITKATELKVFQDLVKMFAVFKVDWPQEVCLLVFKKVFRPRLSTYPGIMECSQLALMMSTKHKDYGYLDQLVAVIDDVVWRRVLPRALKKASTKVEMDFIMVITAEKGLARELVSLIPIVFVPISSEQELDETFLLYLLENFNFSLCKQEAVNELCQDLEELYSEGEWSKVIHSFAKIMGGKEEESNCKAAPPVAAGSGEVPQEGSSSGAPTAVAGGSGESSSSGAAESEAATAGGSEKLLEDGTLATLARMQWAKAEGSTWPCSKSRPFADYPRQLTGGIDLLTAEPPPSKRRKMDAQLEA